MMNMDQIYLITSIPGYTPQISRLISMMNYARYTTLEEVKGLSKEQLDYLLDAESNSIGALLLHFAAVEYAYQVSTFEKGFSMMMNCLSGVQHLSWVRPGKNRSEGMN